MGGPTALTSTVAPRLRSGVLPEAGAWPGPSRPGRGRRRGSGALALEVDLVEAAEEGRVASELAFGADGLDPAGVHQHDAIGELERAEAVGDEEGGAVAGEFLDGLADQGLVLDVDGAGGLVEDQDGRVAEHGAGQGDPLALATGEAEPALADDRVVAVGQTCDELVRIGAAGGGHDLVAGGVAVAVGDVPGDGVLEQDRLLDHHPDLAA